MSKTDKKKKIYMTKQKKRKSDKCKLRCKIAHKEHHKATTSIRRHNSQLTESKLTLLQDYK